MCSVIRTLLKIIAAKVKIECQQLNPCNEEVDRHFIQYESSPKQKHFYTNRRKAILLKKQIFNTASLGLKQIGNSSIIHNIIEYVSYFRYNESVFFDDIIRDEINNAISAKLADQTILELLVSAHSAIIWLMEMLDSCMCEINPNLIEELQMNNQLTNFRKVSLFYLDTIRNAIEITTSIK